MEGFSDGGGSPAGDAGAPGPDAAVDSEIPDASVAPDASPIDPGLNDAGRLDAGGSDAGAPSELDGGVSGLDSGSSSDAGTGADAGGTTDAGGPQDAGQANDGGGQVDAGTDPCDRDFTIQDNEGYGVMAACTTVGGTLRLETGNVSRLSPIDHVVRIVGDWEMIGTSLNRDDLDRMAALSSIGGVIRIENNADLYVCKVEELAARMTPPVSVIDLGGNRNWNICDGND